MTFYIFRTSLAEPPCEGAESQDGGADWLIEIETLGELVELSRRLKQSIILRPHGGQGRMGLEIYDETRE